MSSRLLLDKIVEYMKSAKVDHIMGASVIYQAIEEDPWVNKDELRGIMERAVDHVKHLCSNDYLRCGKIALIMSQFDIAFDSISNLQEIGVLKTNKEKPIGLDEIKHNKNMLKGKLILGMKTKKSELYNELAEILSDIQPSDLTWKDPLASKVISEDSELVRRLSKKQNKKFMKLKENMVPSTMPSTIEKECYRFITDFMAREPLNFRQLLSHDGRWKENDEKLTKVALKILDVLRNVWCNPAFGPEYVSSMNEGTYVNNVIISTISASIDNSFGEHAFITSFERQSVASSDRKGDNRTGRRPDIMFVVEEGGKIYELMYAECSRVICTNQKDEDDSVKLWRETNDGMYWAQKSRKLRNGEFGIIGVQVAGCKMRLSILIRDEFEIHRYYKLSECSIPIRYSNDPSVLTEFIKTLLVLRNILIVNMSILRNTPLRRSTRHIEDSSTIPSE